MRLVRRSSTGKFSLTEDLVAEGTIPPYAVLSHTWGADTEEVTFEDLTNGTGKDKPGYEKIRFCAEQARQDDLQYFWIDTCCINKADYAELSQAIKSMFRWYHKATRCYVYLSDVSSPPFDTNEEFNPPLWESNFRKSRWFTRGWTLQELLAPSSVEFFSQEWERLGDKESLRQQIHKITGIPDLALQGAPLSQFSVNERLSWKEHRQTKLDEDRAYSLLGIFDVYIPPIYGEGMGGAFRRLMDEINKLEKCIQDLRLTDPRDDKKRIEDTKGGLLKDSYRWILENSDFQQWRDDQQSRLLWIKGDPGKGKTMLLCGIINELNKSMTKTHLLSYFFCQATDSRINNATAVLRGLIYLLVDQQPSLISHIRKKHDHAGRALFNDANAWVALSEIFTNILRDPSLNITYLIIDALDECVVGLPKLLDFVQKSRVSSRVKWLVSSRNDTNIERILQLDNSGAKLSLELEDDDTDIESFVDSGYGTTSETSSVYSIANALGAREDILALLLQDEELQILFSSAFEKVSASKFENSFRIMLSQFARELRNEAKDRRERSVAYVVRTIAGYVSNFICKKYGTETDMRAKEMDQLSSQLPHKRQLLERLLNPTLTDTEDLHHEGTSAEDQDYEVEEDNWDENDMVSLPHLEQLEKFVTNSEAMNNLQRDQVTAKESPEIQEQEQTIAHQMLDTHDQDQPPWWRLKNTLQRFTRPSVPMGYRRLEWTCDCGEEMYGDYDNRDPVAVEKLASILQRQACVTRTIEKDSIRPGTNRKENISGYKHTSDNSGGGGAGSSAHYSGTFSSTCSEQSGSTQAPASNQAGATGTNDSLANVQSSFEASSGTALRPTARKKKFLELCVNTGEIDVSLGEIDITDINSDGELFKRIYERYKDLRGHRMRRIFLKPVDVHFIHFSVQGRYRVGIYGQPLVIPPEDEVKAERYHYEECPLKVQPPMDYRTFLHYMNKHKHGDPTKPTGISLHSDAIFLKRLPKKVGTSILASQQSTLQFGWGVHIIEGPNKVALSWTTFFGLALSFAVSMLYCHFWHTQEQGFAIGQWMVAVLGAAMAALYFQWAET
ncbi:HET-domain-containing protein [Zopfia rhizophila CBS 207.26]|uniref:HET-domain-containing protein n=1 Tax=Zopfia rhizophila CBS 207.26 TaxID=1314779 RepID=A0A6A6E1V8_9PEZI|nr:HET-domain-containing protein [Zopfia rhizophila CBS 207.26]